MKLTKSFEISGPLFQSTIPIEKSIANMFHCVITKNNCTLAVKTGGVVEITGCCVIA